MPASYFDQLSYFRAVLPQLIPTSPHFHVPMLVPIGILGRLPIVPLH